jgi:hypothetical protein
MPRRVGLQRQLDLAAIRRVARASGLLDATVGGASATWGPVKSKTPADRQVLRGSVPTETPLARSPGGCASDSA